MLNGIVDDDMFFYTFTDFIYFKDRIKKKLHTKDKDYYFMYRMFVESRPWIKDFYRGCIWDYLNYYMTEDELLSHYETYMKKYGDKRA